MTTKQKTWVRENLKGSFNMGGLYVEHIEMTQERERYKISYINSRDLYIMEDENSVIIDFAKDYGTLAIERDCLLQAQAMQRQEEFNREDNGYPLEDIDDDDADTPAFGD